MDKNFLHKIIIFCMALFLSPLSFAIVSPTVQFQGVADKMITQLESHKTQLHKMSVIRRIVNQVLLPHVDLDRMSASVVGRHWRIATSAQKSQFEKEFSYLVTTTYSSALSSYDDDRVVFQPLRGGYESLKTTRVNSEIIRKNGQHIKITYDLTRAGNQWKVYDFSIEHISMVQSYRAQFSGVLSQGGMPALLARLLNHNRTSE